MNYLASLYEEGLQHRTINTARSAISMTHIQVEGQQVGKHPMVTRLMRGIYNRRPPTPRYSNTWDVQRVTSYLRSLGHNDQLDQKQLTLKLTMLMALVGANRSSELAALDLRFRQVTPFGVSFKMPTLLKKRAPGAPPKEIFFGAYEEDKDLCVVQCMESYELVTQQFRPANSGSADRLLLSHVKPHRPVTAERIAHWLKEVMSKAGVDTSVFKAHSVRGASTSAAKDRGMPMQDILATADWSKESTFRRFYYRPQNSERNEYARRVLMPGQSPVRREC